MCSKWSSSWLRYLVSFLMRTTCMSCQPMEKNVQNSPILYWGAVAKARVAKAFEQQEELLWSTENGRPQCPVAHCQSVLDWRLSAQRCHLLSGRFFVRAACRQSLCRRPGTHCRWILCRLRRCFASLWPLSKTCCMSSAHPVWISQICIKNMRY